MTDVIKGNDLHHPQQAIKLQRSEVFYNIPITTADRNGYPIDFNHFGFQAHSRVMQYNLKLKGKTVEGYKFSMTSL